MTTKSWVHSELSPNVKLLFSIFCYSLQAPIEVMDTSPSPPPPLPPPAPLPVVTTAPPPAVAPRATRQHYNPEENTITNICTSNIILDLPQVTTRSRTGAIKPQPPPVATPPNPPIVTKIITKQTGLQAIGVTAAASSPRQPPPLQQMHSTPPPPRLQQMVHAQAPPPLQAKPRGTATAPPPLQIKVVPSSRQSDSNTSIIVTAGGETPVSSNIKVKVELGHSAHVTREEVAEEGVSSPHHHRTCSPSPERPGSAVMQLCVCFVTQMEVEVNVAPAAGATSATTPNICIRAGCTNPAVASKDWDMEYCSNECVATHCRCVCPLSLSAPVMPFANIYFVSFHLKSFFSVHFSAETSSWLGVPSGRRTPPRSHREKTAWTKGQTKL